MAGTRLYRTTSTHQLVANSDESRDLAVGLIKRLVALHENSQTYEELEI
jgi:hypothetical protein